MATEAEIRAELYQERAAILEFCANMPREQAEREAYREIYGTEPKTKQEPLFP